MNKAITVFESLDALKIAEMREWQSLPAHERLPAVSELTLAAYRMKDSLFHVLRPERTFVQVQRAKR